MESDKAIMEIGRKMCNLNKMLFFRSLKNNRKKEKALKSSHVCVRAIAEQYSHKIQNFHPTYQRAKAFNNWN